MKITILEHGQIQADENGKILFCSEAPTVYWKYENESDYKKTVIKKDDISSVEENSVLYRTENFELIAELIKLGEEEFIIKSSIKNLGSKNVEIARVHLVEAELNDSPNFFSMSKLKDQKQFLTPDSEYPSYYEYINWYWGPRFNVEWNRMKDPVHMLPNYPNAIDVGSFIWGEDSTLTCGFTGPGTAFGEIVYGTCLENPTIFCSVMLDGILLEAGESRQLENLFFYWGNRQDGLESWGHQVAAEMGSRVKEYLPVGYCSWYQKYRFIEGFEFVEAIDSFEKWPQTPGGKVIQLDDGFQKYPGDWSPNGRFADIWTKIPTMIENTGGIPGLWLAPTAIFQEHPLVQENPDIIQRLPDGKPAITFSNWKWCAERVPECKGFDGRAAYLEIDHPKAKELIRNIIKDAVALGYKYLKLDFTYPLSTARVQYNKKKTSFESLRDLYQLFRESAGDDIYICACIGGNWRYAIGYADSSRLGGDIGSSYGMVKKNLPDFLIRSFTNGIWWAGDPDVFFMREENSKMNLEESWLLTGTVGLLGMVFLTSDLGTQWYEEATRRVKLFWNDEGIKTPKKIQIIAKEELPDAVCMTQQNDEILIGIYNFEDESTDGSIDLSKVKGLNYDFNAICLEGDRVPEVHDNLLTIKDMPPHSIRIIRMVKK